MTEPDLKEPHESHYSGKGWNLLKLDETPEWIAAPVVAIALLYAIGLYIAAVVLIPILAVEVFGAAASARADDVYKLLLGLAGLLGGPIVVWRTYSAHQQATVARESHYTSLFTKAVEQLGATLQLTDTIESNGAHHDQVRTEANLEVRLGAIYALERIARDSERDHWPIMEVLCAYIRNPQNCGIPVENTEPSSDPKFSHYKWGQPIPATRVDVQAAVTVLGRRQKNRKLFERRRNLRLDLRSANLQHASISGDFDFADFGSSRLDLAQIRKAHLNNAQLVSVQAIGCYISDTKMENANLQAANFDRSRFVRVDAALASFSEASAVKATVSHVDLSEGELLGINLRGAVIVNSSFEGASLHGANFSDCRCPGKPGSVNFRGAYLDDANFSGTVLLGAAGLSFDQVNVAEGDEKTKLPAGIERPDHWKAKEVLIAE